VTRELIEIDNSSNPAFYASIVNSGRINKENPIKGRKSYRLIWENEIEIPKFSFQIFLFSHSLSEKFRT